MSAPCTVGEQACADCGIPVHYQHREGGNGLPDFIMLTFPDDAWIGWSWSVPYEERTQESRPELMLLCSKMCLVHWFENEEAAGV